MSSAIALLAAIDVRPEGAQRSVGEEPEQGLFGAAFGAELLRSEPQRTELDSERDAEAEGYAEAREAGADRRPVEEEEASAERSDRGVRAGATLPPDPVGVHVAERIALQSGPIVSEAPRVGVSPVPVLQSGPIVSEAPRVGVSPVPVLQSGPIVSEAPRVGVSPVPVLQSGPIVSEAPRVGVSPVPVLQFGPIVSEAPRVDVSPVPALQPEAGPAALELPPRVAGGLPETAAAVAPNADPRARAIEAPLDPTREFAAPGQLREEQGSARVGAAQRSGEAAQSRPERAELLLGPHFRAPDERADARPSAALSQQAERVSAERPLLEVSPLRVGPSELESKRRLPEAGLGRQLAGTDPHRGPALVSASEFRSDERARDAGAERSSAPPALPTVAREATGAERFVLDAPDPRQQHIGTRTATDVAAPLNLQATPLAVGDLPQPELRSTQLASLPATTPGSAGPESIPLQAEWLAARGGGNVRLRLHPPELGEIELKVRVRGKTVEIVIAAQEGAARLLVHEHRDQLSQNLATRGLQMDHFEVRDLPSRDASSGREGNRDSAGGWQQSGDAGGSPRGSRAAIGETHGLPAARAGLAVQPSRSSSTEAVDLRV